MNSTHKFFDATVSNDEPLEKRIETATLSMVRAVGLENTPVARIAVEEQLAPESGSWVFDDLTSRGMSVKGLRVLDMGAGLGGVSLQAVRRGASDVVAIEPGPGWCEIAGERLRLAGKGTAVNVAGETLPFEDASFDLVLSVQVLEHVEKPEAYLREAYRVLRPGGHLWLSCENYMSFRENHYRIPWFPLLPKPIGALYLHLLGRPTSFLLHSVTYTTPPWVYRMLRQCGFEILEEKEIEQKLATATSGKFLMVRRVLGVELGARAIVMANRAKGLFRVGIRTIARKP